MASEEQTQQEPLGFTPSETAIDLTENGDGGLLKEVLRDGSGDSNPLKGDTVAVHYVGTLVDGTKFDSSRDRDELFQFELGKGKVIKGWDVGVASMKKGELARLICKPEYAYGANGSPPAIPPNATLLFEVELFSWKGTDISPGKTGGILKSILTEGTGHDHPNEFSSVEVAVVGKHEGRVFEERELSFLQGEGAEQGVTEGVDIAVKGMKKDEVARLVISPQYGYGSQGHEEYKIPSGATLEYDVTLKSFERCKEAWELDAGEKIEQAEQMKQQGTQHFKNTKYASAKKCYEKVIDYLKSEDSLDGEEKSKRDTLLLQGYLNQAMCDLKLQEHLDVVKSCDAALELDNKNEKAYFRRGTAQLQLQYFEEALSDFNKVLEISPDNKAAKNQITIVKNKVKMAKDKEKKIFGNMFQKFAEIDSQKEDQDIRNRDGLSQIGDWDNEMARGFLPLDKEVEAFGEKMPEPKYMQASKENVDPAGDGGSDIEG